MDNALDALNVIDLVGTLVIVLLYVEGHISLELTVAALVCLGVGSVSLILCCADSKGE